MTAAMTDTAAAAAIGAASRELRLPVVRADAVRLAEIAEHFTPAAVELHHTMGRHSRRGPRR